MTPSSSSFFLSLSLKAWEDAWAPRIPQAASILGVGGKKQKRAICRISGRSLRCCHGLPAAREGCSSRGFLRALLLLLWPRMALRSAGHGAGFSGTGDTGVGGRGTGGRESCQLHLAWQHFTASSAGPTSLVILKEA